MIDWNNYNSLACSTLSMLLKVHGSCWSVNSVGSVEAGSTKHDPCVISQE